MPVYGTVLDGPDSPKRALAGHRRLVITVSITIWVAFSQWQEVGISLFLRR